MTTASPVKKNRVSVLLIDEDVTRAGMLCKVLTQASYLVTHISETGMPLLKQVDSSKPDIIVIDTESPDRDMLESLHMMSNFDPRPVVMFSDRQDTETINKTVQSGVSAYVGRDTDPTNVKPIIDIAIARFNQFQHLRGELEQTRSKLRAQENMSKAKRMLMTSKSMTEEQAYAVMRKMAMNNGQKIEQVADNIIAILSDLA